MSKVNDIKNKMRSQKTISPTFALNEEVGNEENKEEINVPRKERKEDREKARVIRFTHRSAQGIKDAVLITREKYLYIDRRGIREISRRIKVKFEGIYEKT